MIQLEDKVEFYENHIKIIYANYGDEGRNYGELFDFLGDFDIITASELGKDVILVEYDVYLFRDEDEYELHKNGVVELHFLSHLKEYVNEDLDSHKNFLQWFSMRL